MPSRIGTSTLRKRGERKPAMPSSDAADDAERHGDDDRGERQHGALPLAEGGEIEEAAAGERREAGAAGVPGDERGRGEHGDPGKRRQDLDCRRALRRRGSRSRTGWSRAAKGTSSTAAMKRVSSRKVKSPKLASSTSQAIASETQRLQRNAPAARHFEEPSPGRPRRQEEEGERDAKNASEPKAVGPTRTSRPGGWDDRSASSAASRAVRSMRHAFAGSPPRVEQDRPSSPRGRRRRWCCRPRRPRAKSRCARFDLRARPR